jgi:hypothetical protein
MALPRSRLVAISGTTYSALPSGAGVVAVEGGMSSVIVENGHVLSNATGAAGQHKDATPFEDGAAGSRGRLNGVVIATVVVLLVCVVVSSQACFGLASISLKVNLLSLELSVHQFSPTREHHVIRHLTLALGRK